MTESEKPLSENPIIEAIRVLKSFEPFQDVYNIDISNLSPEKIPEVYLALLKLYQGLTTDLRLHWLGGGLSEEEKKNIKELLNRIRDYAGKIDFTSFDELDEAMCIREGTIKVLSESEKPDTK